MKMWHITKEDEYHWKLINYSYCAIRVFFVYDATPNTDVR